MKKIYLRFSNINAIQIIGGSGHIGSHTVKYFQDQNEEIIIIDNMQNWHENAVEADFFYKVDIRDKDKLDMVFKKHSIEAVIHFASISLVGESIEKPY